MMKSIFLLPISVLVLIGCTTPKSPSEVYDEYNAKVQQGISYQEDKAYYTQRKQADVESKFPQYMQQMKQSRDEVIASYLSFSKAAAKCKALTLVSQVIDGDTAVLEYAQKDLCGNASEANEKQRISMINEGGWKIDELQISL